MRERVTWAEKEEEDRGVDLPEYLLDLLIAQHGRVQILYASARGLYLSPANKNTLIE